MHWIDPDFLPETSGVVDLYLLNAEGEADGLVLTDGTEVHFPPHMGAAVLGAVRPGSTVRVRGIRPRGIAMVAAVAVQSEDGARIVDAGPPHGGEDAGPPHGGEDAGPPHGGEARRPAHARRTAMEVEGVLRQKLHGPKGEVRGVLLEDGRSARFPPHAGEDIAALLAPGTRLLLRGDGFATEHGTVIAVREIGSSRDDLRRVR